MPLQSPQASCFSGLFGQSTRGWKLRSPLVRNVTPDSGVATSEGSYSERAPPYGEFKHESKSIGLSCNFSCGPESDWWHENDPLPSYSHGSTETALDPKILETIEAKVDELNSGLRDLSMQIHGHPELQFNEKFAHDLLTSYMAHHGFKVTKHHLGLKTAWRAEFTQGSNGRVLGVNSEMDALPGIGHACGHNLIAISGVGIAIAVKAALEAHNIPGKVVLLGTPAEEGGGGKAILIERGGYSDMDACIMCHPGPGLPHSSSDGSTNALQTIVVEYFGQAAHAGSAPWEGVNALDAAFLAYANISTLRQQIKPDHRVHGTVEGRDWYPNIIPDYAKMTWLVRAPNITELNVLVKRVKACFEAASHATGCKIHLKVDHPYYDLRQNKVLAKDFSDAVSRYGMVTNSIGSTASTDFGNVSYEMPSFHPLYAIPTEPGGGNHTPGFTKAAATLEAHDATIKVIKGLAQTGFRLLADSRFFGEVQEAFSSGK